MRSAPLETLIELAELRRSASGACPMCRGLMRPWRAAGLNPSVDHIVPRAWKGDNSIENLRLMCRECNTLRGSVDHCVGALACVLAVAKPSGAARIWAKWRPVARMTPDLQKVIRRVVPKPAPIKPPEAKPFVPPDPSVFYPISPLDTYGGKNVRRLTARLVKIGGIIAMRAGVKSV
jgi:hypothetical protein